MNYEWQAKLQFEAETEIDALLRLNDTILKEEKEKKATAKNLASAVINSSSVPVNYNLDGQLKAIDELYRKGFSKVIVVSKENGELERYRVTQANKSFITTEDGVKINVIGRFAPMASVLITAKIDDEIEFQGKSIGIVEHINFVHKNAYKNDEIELLELIESEEDLLKRIKKKSKIRKRAVVATSEQASALEVAESASEYNEVEQAQELVQTLSSDFYVNTTNEQEELIGLPNRGAISVTGVAGSGKTSIALGRVKKFYSCNQFDEEHEDYDSFFRDPGKMVGFVLHKQLVPYLKETCADLDMANMPIKEYKELNRDLIQNYQAMLQLRMQGAGKYSRNKRDFVFTEQQSMEWLRTVEKEITHMIVGDVINELTDVERYISAYFDKHVTASKSVLRLKQYLLQVWKEFYSSAVEKLSKRKNTSGKWNFYCIELVSFLDKLSLEWSQKLSDEKAYYIHEGRVSEKRYDAFYERVYPFSAANLDSKSREYLAKLKRAVINKVRSTFFMSDSGKKLAVTDKYLSFLAEQNHKEDARVEIKELYEIVSQAQLTYADVDLLACICDLLCWKTSSRDTVPQDLTERPKYTSVFIDEVQDFTALQVFAMALQADPSRCAITVVGDFKQQLYLGKVEGLSECLPMMNREEPYVLSKNMRQPPVLARYAQHVRDVLEGREADESLLNFNSEELQRKQIKADALEEQVLSFLGECEQNHSVCVICPSEEIAKTLESELKDDIETELWRESHLTQNSAELNKVIYVHFTTAKPTKGLEFDHVVIPHFEQMSLDNAIEGNHTYVAVSRAKKRLLLLDVTN